MDSTQPRRRDFVRALALGGPAGLVVGAGTARSGADDPPKPQGAADPTPPKSDRPAPKEADSTDDAEVEARMTLVLARYGDRLDEEARKTVRAEVASIVRRARDLRRVPLDNGTGPAPVFLPHRAPLA